MKTWWNNLIEIYFRFKGLADVGIGQIVNTLIIGVFWVIVAALLGAEDYGELSYFIAIASIATTVSLLGMTTPMIVYSAKKVDIQSTLFVIVIISSSITALVVYFIVNNAAVSIYIIGVAIFSLTVNELIGRKLYGVYSKFLILQRILLFCLGIGLFYVLGPNGIILGYAISFLPFSFKMIQICKKSKLNFNLLKPRLGFITNNYLLDLVRSLSVSLDKLIIGPIFGFALLGNYHLGVQILTILTVAPTIVFVYSLPQDSTGKLKNRLKKVMVAVSVVLALATFLLAPALIPIAFPTFDETVQVAQILGLAIIPRTVSFMFISKFLGQEKSKMVVIGSGIFLVTQISGIFLLGDLYGSIGMAWALVIGSILEATFLAGSSKLLKKSKVP